MKNIILAILILVICVALVGCGETISGVGKDVNRMGQGINTFFSAVIEVLPAKF